jgi:YHS domain-containing protein
MRTSCTQMEEFSGAAKPVVFSGSQPQCTELLAIYRNGKVFANTPGERQFFLEEENMMTDPVCGMRVNEKNAEYQAQFAGRKYYFCSEECRKEFEADPSEYVEMAAA